MKKLNNINSLYDLHSIFLKESIDLDSELNIKNLTTIDKDFLNCIISSLSKNLKFNMITLRSNIILNNLLLSYILIKNYNYSYKIIETKIKNTIYSISKKNKVIFQAGTYEPKNKNNEVDLLKLLIDTKHKLLEEFPLGYNHLVNKSLYFKLVNDIITLTVLLMNNYNLNYNLLEVGNLIRYKDFKIDFNSEINLGKDLLLKAS